MATDAQAGVGSRLLRNWVDGGWVVLAGCVSFRGPASAVLKDSIAQMWSRDGRVVGAHTEDDKSFILASSPRSRMWQTAASSDRLVCSWRSSTATLDDYWRLHQGDTDVSPKHGVFATVSFDGYRLQLLTDSFSQVPLYWARVPDGVVFSSVFQDFLDLPDPPVIDESMVARVRHSANSVYEQSTTLVGVNRVLGGRLTKITASDEDSVDVLKLHTVPSNHGQTVNDSVEQLAQAISDAVAASLDPSDAIGAHLSGGFDSTMIAVLAQQELACTGSELRRLYSWSPRTKARGRGEIRLVDETAQLLGVPCWFAPPHQSDRPTDVAIDPWQMLGREIHCLHDARSQGINVLLSGWGGDDFASYSGRHLAENLFRRGEYMQAIRQVRSESQFGRRGLGFRVRPWIAKAAKRYLRSRHLTQPCEVGPADPRYPMQQAQEAYWEATTTREIMLALREWRHLDYRIEHWWEAGRRNGVEYRYPLLDVGVVRASLSIPETHWAHSGTKRYLSRMLMLRWFPTWRPIGNGKREPELDAYREALRGRL